MCTLTVYKSREKYFLLKKEKGEKRINVSLDSATSRIHTCRSVAIIATHKLLVGRKEKKSRRMRNEQKWKKNVRRKYDEREKKNYAYNSGQMENKYKNEIPNIMLDDAHSNCASIPFIVMKWFGKTMPAQRPSFKQDSNNASIKSDQAAAFAIGQLPSMCGYANAYHKFMIRQKSSRSLAKRIYRIMQ